MAWQLRRDCASKLGPVKQVVLALLDLVEGIESLAHDAVAGRAGTAHVAGMFDLDAVV